MNNRSAIRENAWTGKIHLVESFKNKAGEAIYSRYEQPSKQHHNFLAMDQRRNQFILFNLKTPPND